MSDHRGDEAVTRQVVCVHCGAEVFWGLPRPEDPCIECGKPINRRDDGEDKAVAGGGRILAPYCDEATDSSHSSSHGLDYRV